MAMPQNFWTPPTQNVPRGGRGWLHVLLTGIGLFIVATVVMFLTGNPNLYPTVILVGIVVLAVLYRRARRQNIYQPPPPNF